VEKAFKGCWARLIWRTPDAPSLRSERKAKTQKRNQ
jgi:hypothetical protein